MQTNTQVMKSYYYAPLIVSFFTFRLKVQCLKIKLSSNIVNSYACQNNFVLSYNNIVVSKVILSQFEFGIH